MLEFAFFCFGVNILLYKSRCKIEDPDMKVSGLI